MTKQDMAFIKKEKEETRGGVFVIIMLQIVFFIMTAILIVYHG